MHVIDDQLDEVAAFVDARPDEGIRVIFRLQLRHRRRGRHRARGVAVDGRRGGEYELLKTEVGHRAEHGVEATDVLPVVPLRVLHRLADLLAGGEVDDGVDAFDEHEARELLARAEAGEVEVKVGVALDAFDLTGREVVDDDGFIAALGQQSNDVRTDIAGPAGHQH